MKKNLNIMWRCRQLAILVISLWLIGLSAPVFAQKKENPAASQQRSISTILRAVVGIYSKIPPDATTAEALGTEREGSGVVIDSSGLVLTIGYLILEASDIVITRPGGNKIDADFVGYDHSTGFGLIRAKKPLNLTPVKLGNSDKLTPGKRVMIVSHSGMPPVSAAQVVSRRPFAGYWEFLLENAIFSSPPHANHGGAALFDESGKLQGIGSLFVNDAITPNVELPGNMFVPVNNLKGVMVDLLEHGRPKGPAIPWMGIQSADAQGKIMVVRVTKRGPGYKAGIRAGDEIVGVNGKPVKTLEELFRKVHALGKAGVKVPLDIVRKNTTGLDVQRVQVRSQDRHDWLKIKKR